jgi:hypothetical protein
MTLTSDYFNYLMSLGTHCQSRYHISGVLDKTFHKETRFHKFRGEKTGEDFDFGSHYFDWSVSPLSGVFSVLSTRFQGVFKRSNLSLEAFTAPNGGEPKQTVVDSINGFTYPHTFSNTNIGSASLESIFEEYPAQKNKMDYLVKKTIQVLSDNSLRKMYVICLNHDYQINTLENIVDVLNVKYDTNYVVYVALLGKEWGKEKGNFSQISDKVFLKKIELQPYPGNLQAWDEFFSGIKVRRKQ